MEFGLDSQGLLTLANQSIFLRQAHPIVNGQQLENLHFTVLQADARACLIQYHSPMLGNGSFTIEVALNGEKLGVRYWLENIPSEMRLENFGLRFTAVENVRQYLRNGYFSWDGSFYVQPGALHNVEQESRPETGYAMTQILPTQGNETLVLGFDRHDRFQHTFTFDTSCQPLTLTILTLWDEKDRTGLARCESERLLIIAREGAEDALREWARDVAAAAPTPPRLSSLPITGWCSWYNLYAAITEENILQHLKNAAEATQKIDLPMRVFQIDDGFTPEMGDWLDVKPQFPRGMKPVLEEIRAAGFIPGLWIAPFMVGNRSRLYQAHPNWVLKDRQTGGPLVQMSFYGEFRWHKRSEEYYILDTTHPEALAYLRQVFHTWRWEWGCEYFKTDFMHFGAAHGPDRAIYHAPGTTRIENWRRVAELIRSEIGEAIWSGCGFPLWAAVGLVDSVRIGRDVGVEWAGNYSAQSLLRDQTTRNFANQIVWQADPDCVLLRHRYHHLTEIELRSLALFSGMSGGAILTSDDLGELSPERLQLWKFILPKERAICHFPFLGQTDLYYERTENSSQTSYVARSVDPVIVQVRQIQNGFAVFLFNTGDVAVQREYSFKALGLPNAGYVSNWLTGEALDQRVEEIVIDLAPHDSVLFFVSQQLHSPISEILG